MALRNLTLGVILAFSAACGVDEIDLVDGASTELRGDSYDRDEEHSEGEDLGDRGEHDDRGEDADTCKTRCSRRARAWYGDCVDRGVDEHRCASRAKELYRECVADHCGDDDESGDVCESRCAKRARAWYGDCVDRGVHEDRCAARAKTLYRECVADHCDHEEGH